MGTNHITNLPKYAGKNHEKAKLGNTSQFDNDKNLLYIYYGRRWIKKDNPNQPIQKRGWKKEVGAC
jgi:hypothetical protein